MVYGSRRSTTVPPSQGSGSQAVQSTQAIPLQTTANFITAFDTNVHVANAVIEIGMDLLSDSPVPLGQIVTEKYGEALLGWLVSLGV